MTGFLHVLAGMALGVPSAGAAQVSLPPRYAPKSAGLDAELQVAQARESQPGDDAGSAVRPAPGPSHPSQDGRSLPGEDGAVQPLTAAPDRQRAFETRGQTTTAVAAPFFRQAPFAGPLPRTVRQPDPANAPLDIAPRSMDARRPLQIDSVAPPRESGPQTALPWPALQPGLPRRAAPQAPLSAAALAGRSMVAREQPTIVQVTIDRIDVRAPSPAAAKPQRRAPPQPALSLSDYLRDDAKARRP